MAKRLMACHSATIRPSIVKAVKVAADIQRAVKETAILIRAPYGADPPVRVRD